MKTKEKKQWKSVLVNRVDKTEWTFPTKAVGTYSGIVVEMTGRDLETGEGIGRVLITEGDRHEDTIKRTWQLQNFIPVDGTIEKVEILKKEKA
jgi:hypothetical protein